MFGGFGALVGVPEVPGWENYPSQMWMSLLYDEKCGWCGYLWLHDISLTKRITRTHFLLFPPITWIGNQIARYFCMIEMGKTASF